MALNCMFWLLFFFIYQDYINLQGYLIKSTSNSMIKYIDKKGQQAILNFKYKGGSVSFSYGAIWSPLADYLLQKLIPLSWAPNLITFIGLCFLISGWYTLYMIPMNVSPPEIYCLVFGICLFMYQTLDNIDGKQARRTKSSSALGMLFDHGCDAFGSMFMSYSMGRIVFINNPILFILGSSNGIILGFFFSVWAQYHSGGLMILGRVNAVDDGLPLTWMLSILTCFIGIQFWQQTIFAIPLKHYFITLVLIGGFAQVISLVKNTKGNFTKNKLKAFSELFHLLMLMGSFSCISIYTDWLREEKFFYIMYFSMCIVYVRDITYFQVCVLTQTKFNQFQLSTCVYIIGYPLYIGLRQFGITICPEHIFVKSMLIFFFVEYFHYAIAIVRQIANVLKINVFSLKKVNDD